MADSTDRSTENPLINCDKLIDYVVCQSVFSSQLSAISFND